MQAGVTYPRVSSRPTGSLDFRLVHSPDPWSRFLTILLCSDACVGSAPLGVLTDSKSETSHGIRDGQELSQRTGHKGPAGEGALFLEEFLSASAVQVPGGAGWRGPPRQLVFT